MNIERLFAATIIGAALTCGIIALQSDRALAVPADQALVLSTTPLPLDRDDPAKTGIGALRFLGAVQLRSTNAAFGGISGLRAGAATPSGTRLLAITDTGNWLAFDTVEAGGRLTGVANAVLAPILGPDGTPPTSKADGDAEALEWNPATGAATIAYEQDHRLVAFAGIDAGRPASLAGVPLRTDRLTEMTGWPANGGAESVVILNSGARLVISETDVGSTGARTALLTRNGTTSRIDIEGVPDHSPTDAIALDATRVLILHRRFTALQGQGAAITLVDLAPALAGTATPPLAGTATPPLAATATNLLPGRLIARWEPPATLDNMEGIAIRRDGGRTFLYLVSDDNLNSIQRTLLMKFELDMPAASGSH